MPRSGATNAEVLALLKLAFGANANTAPKNWYVLASSTPINADGTGATEPTDPAYTRIQINNNNALQIFGGYGYTKDFPAEKYYRDSKL